MWWSRPRCGNPVPSPSSSSSVVVSLPLSFFPTSQTPLESPIHSSILGRLFCVFRGVSCSFILLLQVSFFSSSTVFNYWVGLDFDHWSPLLWFFIQFLADYCYLYSWVWFGFGDFSTVACIIAASVIWVWLNFSISVCLSHFSYLHGVGVVDFIDVISIFIRVSANFV